MGLEGPQVVGLQGVEGVEGLLGIQVVGELQVEAPMTLLLDSQLVRKQLEVPQVWQRHLELEHLDHLAPDQRHTDEATTEAPQGKKDKRRRRKTLF